MYKKCYYVIITRYMYNEKKYPCNCFAMTMYQSLLMALVHVSTFLSTRKLGPDKVHV